MDWQLVSAPVMVIGGAITALATLVIAIVGMRGIVQSTNIPKTEITDTIKRHIATSEKRQDSLRKAELKPIIEQVSNHIPTEIKSIHTRIDAIAETQNTMAEKQNAMEETQNAMIQTQNTMVEKQNAMEETQNTIIQTQNAMLDTQKQLVKSQDKILTHLQIKDKK